jgi:hypothetical protein
MEIYIPSRKSMKTLSTEQLEADVGNAIYAAALIFEALEGAGRIHGNGHHIAQEIATYSKKIFKERAVNQETS